MTAKKKTDELRQAMNEPIPRTFPFSNLEIIKSIKILRRLLSVFLDQSIEESFLTGIALHLYPVLAGGFVRYGRRQATHAHTQLLHAVDHIGEVIQVGLRTHYFTGFFTVIANDLPAFGVHDQSDYARR